MLQTFLSNEKVVLGLQLSSLTALRNAHHRAVLKSMAWEGCFILFR